MKNKQRLGQAGAVILSLALGMGNTVARLLLSSEQERDEPRTIDDPRDTKLLDPKLELVTELRPLEAHQHDRLPGSFRALLRVMDLFPSLRRMNRLLRYRF